MKPILNVLDLTLTPIFEQLKWEEALLRTDTRNWCVINRGTSPAIVMGISGKPEKLICHKRLFQSPLPIIRRFSGGGTVVVDEETLFVTFICQTTDLEFPAFPRQIMQWTTDLYHSLFPTYHFQLQENDYAIGEKKFGGNAQSIIKGRWLHHSSLLWDFKPDLMDYLLMPPKMPTYRHGRLHNDFLCRLKEYWPDKNQFFSELMNRLTEQFILEKKDEEEIKPIAAMPHRKVTCLIENDLFCR